ncbi:hypothetical protein FDA94_18810 [Herbidospora galbida]|uniref:Transposase DDE domain-containing protein n=1 Tax=Herbidospora galbida TaxID=2575442 RepID=A0A4U3MCV4_9ACTN|nr:hypothetical protein FDA94_18810 [Herbidospora galbida]
MIPEDNRARPSPGTVHRHLRKTRCRLFHWALPSRADLGGTSRGDQTRAVAPGGFDLDQVPLSAPSGRNRQRKTFCTGQCAGCPLRPRCTKAEAGRVLTIRPHRDELAAARRKAATDPARQEDYRRWRPPVERAIAWIVARGNGTRGQHRCRAPHANKIFSGLLAE